MEPECGNRESGVDGIVGARRGRTRTIGGIGFDSRGVHQTMSRLWGAERPPEVVQGLNNGKA